MSISDQFLGDGPIPGASFTEEVGVVTYEDSGCSASTERPASRSSKLFTGLKEMCVELSYVTGVAAA